MPRLYREWPVVSKKAKNKTVIQTVSVVIFMGAMAWASVPFYDWFCRVTGFGGTTQNAESKEIPKIVINQDYKIRFDTNSNGALDWKFYPEKNTIILIKCKNINMNLR